jgi:hypothetical protein
MRDVRENWRRAMLHPMAVNATSLLTGLVLLIGTLPAAGQSLPEPWADPLDHPGRVDVSLSLGLAAPTDWSDLVVLGSISPATGVIEQVLVRDLRVKGDRELGGAVTYWRGRYGFRGQASLSKSSLVIGGGPVDASVPLLAAEPSVSVDLDTWSYDVRGVIGMIEYDPQRWMWPYASFGFGGITYDLARPVRPPLLTFIEHSGPATADKLVVVDHQSRELLLAVNELSQDSVFAFNLAIGTDLRLPLGPGGVGLRFELSDHIASSPVGLRIRELRRGNVLVTDTGVGSGLVHHLRAAAGLVVYIRR